MEFGGVASFTLNPKPLSSQTLNPYRSPGRRRKASEASPGTRRQVGGGSDPAQKRLVGSRSSGLSARSLQPHLLTLNLEL